ncbi:MAG: transcription antitermination factor NusB [Desulfobacteraceae bacterium]|nr:transcription antitermination factor NusB [Desulfobacteraceae bacterium]
MGQRRKSREVALQMLYQLEMTAESPREAIDLYYGLTDSDEDKEPLIPESVKPFAEKLVNGVFLHRDEIDKMIVAASENWRLERMSIIDRNVLRIAVFEMLYCLEIPPKVSINEAIDLGKTFGSPDSGAFINGILDHLLPEITRVREP